MIDAENPIYFKRWQKSWLSQFLKNWLEAKKPILDQINSMSSEKNLKLLDVGCGTGLFLKHAEKYFQTFGIDGSSYATSYAKNYTKKSQISKDEVPEGLKKYHTSSFDIIVAFDLLEHLSEPEKTLHEIRRILKPQGIIILSTPNTSSLGRRIKKNRWAGFTDQTHKSILSNQEWEDKITDNKLQIIRKNYDYLWDIPYFTPQKLMILELISIKALTFLLNLLGINKFSLLGENLIIFAQKETNSP